MTRARPPYVCVCVSAGQKLVDFLLDPTAQKNKKAPKVTDQDEAIEIGKTLLRDGFFHKCLKVKKGEMEVSPNQRWEEGAFYSWDYEGSKTFSNLMTGLLIVGFLTVTCFPIWPQFLKARARVRARVRSRPRKSRGPRRRFFTRARPVSLVRGTIRRCGCGTCRSRCSS